MDSRTTLRPKETTRSMKKDNAFLPASIIATEENQLGILFSGVGGGAVLPTNKNTVEAVFLPCAFR